MIEWSEIQQFIVTLLAFVAIFMAIYKFFEAIKKIKKPSDDLRRTVEEHSKWLEEDKKRMDHIEEGQKILLSCTLAQIDHSITGNSIENLKKAKQKVTDYLVNKEE